MTKLNLQLSWFRHLLRIKWLYILKAFLYSHSKNVLHFLTKIIQAVNYSDSQNVLDKLFSYTFTKIILNKLKYDNLSAISMDFSTNLLIYFPKQLPVGWKLKLRKIGLLLETLFVCHLFKNEEWMFKYSIKC